jgi:hypothetical protein
MQENKVENWLKNTRTEEVEAGRYVLFLNKRVWKDCNTSGLVTEVW